ncbi:MAG: hypothetical protein ACYTGN_14615, partial [Planctomycetota bacterium]
MEFRSLFGAVVLLLAGCQTYEPEPLDPQQIFLDTRSLRSGAAVVSLSQATALMREHSPEIREARAEYATAVAVAGIKT